MKIVKLSATNFKRIKAVEIEPDGNVVIVRGPNSAGKSSVLDAIWAALGGKSAVPDQPIRHGEKKASVVLNIGDYTVTRTFTEDDSYLKVTTRDGAKIANPQKLLDSIVGSISFDPLEFARSKDRAAILAKALNVDFSSLNAERAKMYDMRREANATVKSLETHLSGVLSKFPGMGIDEILAITPMSIDDVTAELRAAQSLHAGAKMREGDLNVLKEEKDRLTKKEAELIDTLAQVREKLNRLRVIVDVEEEALKCDIENLPDIDKIAATYENLAAHNERARIAQDVRTFKIELGKARVLAAQRDAAISEIDQRKQDAIESTSLPVPGLTFDENDVYLNGVPIGQCSTSEQIRASVGIAILLNPQLRVIRISEGSLLDNSTMKMLGDMVDAGDVQAWVEVVDESEDGVGVLIEDGTVKQITKETHKNER